MVIRPIYLALCMITMLVSCDTMSDKRVTLWRNDKIAYGTWYAFDNLKHIFPEAAINTSAVSPVSFYDGPDSNAAYIIIGKYVKPDEKELNAIINYASHGNHVFMSAAVFGDNLLDSFHLEATEFEPEMFFGDSMTLAVRDQSNHRWVTFAYPGYAIDNHVIRMDSSLGYIMGENRGGKVNFVRFRYATGGTVTFQFAPGAFTNFFLLHKNNKRYYDMAMSTLPANIRKVRWDDYYRRHTNGQDNANRNSFSKLGAFMNHPILRWAFWLTVILFALIYLFESKRKQRPIAIIPALRNSSLDFVQTIGRLYFQRKDNKNLAQKMSANFLGQVRAHYNLSTTAINEEFEKKLAFKSGQPLETIKQLTTFIHQSETETSVSDEALLTFSKQTDEFYKKT